MVDIFGIGAFNGMLSAAKSLKDINDTVVRNQASIDLQGQILTAQGEYAALLDKVRALETKLATFENWETEKQRYELKDHPAVDDPVRAYALKDGVQAPEIPHSICPDCYSQRKKSILQTERRVGGARVMTCHVCGWDGYLSGFAPAGGRSRR
jgi:hypothetical protein